ncbi:MAG: hypothetical protein GF330_02135 [Candidatus Eisenbacteria bacterium]|nr:hypothetical protein [Candidatus Eisenbacteria bacterium]
MIHGRLPRAAAAPRDLACLGVLFALLLATVPAFASADRATPDRPPGASSIREIPKPDPATMGPERPIGDLSLPTTPPDDPQVGDSWVWWLWVHWPMPPHWEQRVLTVRGKSDHAYVVVDDAEWNVDIDQADVDLILERWENSSIGDEPDKGIYEINSTYFGEPPDELDDDPRIYLVWFDFGISSDGFFFYYDQYPEGTYPGYHSNECETLYLNTDNGQEPSGDYMISVIAHEFEHLIHWKYDENELLWVDEGMAELAMYFYGRPDQITGFNGNPDNPLDTFEGYWSDYIKTYLWSLYFFERYGGHDAVYDLVHETDDSFVGYDDVLAAHGYGATSADVFADWAVANFLDDPSIDDGRFGYLGDELPPFNVMGTFDEYPVIDEVRTVNSWATDYYRFREMTGFSALELSFDGADAHTFAIWGLALHGDGTTDVHRMTLDAGTQSGTLAVPGLQDPTDEVILVVANNSPGGIAAYSFGAAPGAADVRDPAPLAGSPARRIQMRATPNPSQEETRLVLQWPAADAPDAPRVEILDAQGRLVRALSAASADQADPLGDKRQLTLRWDGHLADGRPAPQGVYYARARLGDLRGRTLLLRLR